MLKCNIDNTGKRLRLYSGLFDLLVAAIVMLITWFGLIETWGWIAGGVLLLIGLFAIFEALRGWCILRALGIKTPF
ncbi:hypothetical protein KS4_16880 [Poriferisphaera corsica]|uniref:DUF2892 domain-containing protein n=1 Tax=Poriferisphaera corsica TaxID=2528020 RepID=A0A517YTS9_9BACT|nr:hypothetical protein [Poriferisphaera corsica]QDU33633.1 hypothetical protein KS4_16880 [Poriferisphaera corsica]